MSQYELPKGRIKSETIYTVPSAYDKLQFENIKGDDKIVEKKMETPSDNNSLKEETARITYP